MTIIEIERAGFQFFAVGLGVFLGFWLNSRFQVRNRLTEARADWAASAEMCLGAIGSSRSVSTTSDDPAHSQDVADVQTRGRLVGTTEADLRAATVRLLLLDKTKASKAEVSSIEEKIVNLCDSIDPDLETREKLDVERARVRACVARWG